MTSTSEPEIRGRTRRSPLFLLKENVPSVPEVLNVKNKSALYFLVDVAHPPGMETFNTRVTANPENHHRVVIWLFQMIAAKAISIPSGMHMMVTTNGQTSAPCSFTRRRYLSSVDWAPEPPGRGDRLIMMFMYVRVTAPTPNKSTPETSIRIQRYDIINLRIWC